MSLRISLPHFSRPHEIVVIEKVPTLSEDEDEPTWPGRALPRAARRMHGPPWAEGRRPPWAAVLPEPEPIAPPAVPSFGRMPVPTDLPDDGAAVVPEPVDVVIVPEPPAGMVWVPPRTIRLGERAFEVEGHFLDRHLVTRGVWAEYLRATGEAPPEGWRGGKPPAGTEALPVTDVTWDDAQRYAEWRGARLPTVAEWLAAAAGLTWFPPQPEQCGTGLCHCLRTGKHAGPAPVGTHKASDSIDGCSDLLGNVWEWAGPDDRLPPPDVDHNWALGGSFKHACSRQPNSWGGYVPQTMIHHAKSWPHLGFRCARSVT